MNYQNRLYIWSPLFSPERTSMSRGYIMTLLPVQPDTPQWGGGGCSNRVSSPWWTWVAKHDCLCNSVSGILAPHRWGSLIRLGVHSRVLGIIKHCRSFFWRGGMRAQGFAGRTQRSYSLRGWRPCSESKLYFTPFHPASWHHWWDNYWITFIKEMEF